MGKGGAVCSQQKKRRDAEYLAMPLVLVFDDLAGACYNAVHDPLIHNQEGCMALSKIPSSRSQPMETTTRCRRD
jgi:hypothetical protein